MHRQQGYALLELTLAALIATLLAVWGAGILANRINDGAAQSSAAWMAMVKNAVQAYIERYDQALLTASGTTELAHKGYANWSAPSVAELKADGLLSAGFPERGTGGLSIAVVLMRRDSCGAGACRLEALVHSTQAMVRRGHVDEQMIAQWLLAAQGWGGVVSRLRPDHVGGASFGYSNPPVTGMDALPVGTLAMAVTTGQLAHPDYLRVRDERDPDFRGSASIAGDLKTEGSLSIKNYLTIGAEEAAFTSCSQNGAVARQSFGGLLICRGSSWRQAGGGGGGGFSVNTLYGCRTSSGSSSANPATGACSCPPGFAMTTISDSGSHPPPEGRTVGYLCVE